MRPFLLCLIPVVVFATLPAKAAESDPLYRLDFADGSFANTGTVGGQAEENPDYKGPTQVEIERGGGNGWEARFQPFPNGSQGPSLVLPDSGAQLGLGNEEDELTIAVWVKWDGPDKHPDFKQPIVWKPFNDSVCEWALSMGETGSLRFDWSKAGGTAGGNRISEQTIPAGEWHHVAAVWKNNDKGGLEYYIDGAPVAPTVKFTGGGPLDASDRPIVVGANPRGNMPFNGAMRGLRLYNRALTADEIEALAKP